jgi:hypothetical protein
MPNSLMRSLRTLFKVKRTEREMERELRLHLEMEAEENVRQYGLNREPTDELYRPVRQTGGAGNLLVRTTVAPSVMMAQLRQAVYAVDPENAIDQAQTLENVRNESIASESSGRR